MKTDGEFFLESHSLGAATGKWTEGAMSNRELGVTARFTYLLSRLPFDPSTFLKLCTPVIGISLALAHNYTPYLEARLSLASKTYT